MIKVTFVELESHLQLVTFGALLEMGVSKNELKCDILTDVAHEQIGGKLGPSFQIFISFVP